MERRKLRSGIQIKKRAGQSNGKGSSLVPIDILIELTRERLNNQLNRLRLLTTKANVMIGVDAITAIGSISEKAVYTPLFWFMVITAIACAVCGLIAIFPWYFGEGPPLRDAANNLLSDDHKYASTQKWIAYSNILSYEDNDTVLRYMAMALFVGTVFLLLSLGARFTLQVIHFA